jgi:hypothetical protein
LSPIKYSHNQSTYFFKVKGDNKDTYSSYTQFKQYLDSFSYSLISLEIFEALCKKHLEFVLLPFLKIRSTLPPIPHAINAVNLEKSPVLWPSLNSDYITKLCEFIKSETRQSSQKEQSLKIKEAQHTVSATNVCALKDRYYICTKCWQIFSEDSPDCIDRVTYLNGVLMLNGIRYECSISIMPMILYIEYDTNKSIIVPISQSKISYDGCKIIIMLKTKALSLLLNNELDVLSLIEAFDIRLPVNILVNDIDVSNQIQESKGQKYSKYKQYQHSPNNEQRFSNLKKLNQIINHPNILKVSRIFHRSDADYVGNLISRIRRTSSMH